MASNIKFSFPGVPLSITNRLVSYDDAIDRSAPFSFIEFIKKSEVSYDIEEMREFYEDYINKWSSQTSEKENTRDDIITERYREFLRDVSLTYTTNDEKKFLSTIDLDDNDDIKIASSFYSKKLKDIIKYYKVKRELVKYDLTKYKLKGSSFGTVRNIKELLITHLSNRDDLIDYDIDKIRSAIEVDIQELYDGYSEYLNQVPNEYVPGHLGFGFDEDVSIFLNNEDLFEGVSDELKRLREVDDLIENKKSLTMKSMGTDYYFLSSNSLSQYVTGSLFDAELPYSNFMNRDHPTIAVKTQDDLMTKEDVGFFRPSKTSFITIHADKFNFSIDNVPADSLILFPDPILYGNDNEAFTFSVDTSQLKRNIFSGNAKHQPKTDSSDINAIGYVSDVDPTKKLGDDLDFIYDEGYIDDSKSDVFGNVFGLIKDNDNFRPIITSIPNQRTIKSLLLNGHSFFDIDYGEGYDFDYSIADNTTYIETIRSGLTATTSAEISGHPWIDPELWDDDAPWPSTFGLPLSTYTLFFRSFTPYEELTDPKEFTYGRNVEDVDLYDGALFNYNNTVLPDPISSDLDVFPGSNQYYFSILLEGGVHSNDPITRATVTLPADFTQNVRLSGDNGVLDIDAGLFTDDNNLNYEHINTPVYEYFDDVSNTTSTQSLSTIEEIYDVRRQLAGKIYVKNKTSGSVENLTSAVPYLSGKYTSSISTQLSSNILNFDMMYNTLFLQLSSDLIIDRPNYVEGVFTDSYSPNMVVSYNADPFNSLSDRFKRDSSVLFFTTSLLEDSLSATNDKVVYPTIYEYSYIDNDLKVIYPPTVAGELVIDTNLFSLSGGNINIMEVSTPTITYNDINNMYCISWISKDQNKSPNLFSFLFNYTEGGEVEFSSGDKYAATSSSMSNIFDTLTLTPIMTSGDALVEDNTLIL